MAAAAPPPPTTTTRRIVRRTWWLENRNRCCKRFGNPAVRLLPSLVMALFFFLAASLLIGAAAFAFHPQTTIPSRPLFAPAIASVSTNSLLLPLHATTTDASDNGRDDDEEEEFFDASFSFSTERLVSKSGLPVCRYALGGAARSTQPKSIVNEYRERVENAIVGANATPAAPFLFYYNPHRYPDFMRGIRELANKDSGNNPIRREDLFLASGGTDRSQKGMEQRLRDALAYSGGDYLDLFVLEYVCPEEAGDDSGDLVKALELARSWVRDGSVRYVGASTHSHSVGAWLGSLDRGEERDNDNDNDGASSPLPLLDAMMLRYNMGHKAAAEALSLPVCAERGIPVLAFTTTRWNRLQDGHPDWGQRAPTTPECLSFALSASSDERGASAGPDAPTTTEDGAGRPIEIVLHSARDAEELGEGMSCLDSSFVPPTIDAGNRAAVAIWRDYGDLEWNDMDGFDEYPEEQQGTSIL